MNTKLTVLAVLVAMVGMAWGDVASPRPRWTAVQMRSEEVNISAAPDKVRVEASFVMYNHGKEESVKMGYPVGLLEDQLHEFTVSVDGEAVSQVSDDTDGSGGTLRPGGGGTRDYRFSGPYRMWKVFQVPMKANQQRVVKLSYWVTPARVTENTLGEVLCYSYTLKTGATWKGNIEQAVLRVKLDGIDPQQLVKATPAGRATSDDGRTLTWKFRDFKPSEDIVVAWRPSK